MKKNLFILISFLFVNIFFTEVYAQRKVVFRSAQHLCYDNGWSSAKLSLFSNGDCSFRSEDGMRFSGSYTLADGTVYIEWDDGTTMSASYKSNNSGGAAIVYLSGVAFKACP